MSKIYQIENPTIGDLEPGDKVRFPDGGIYECKGTKRVKKALGGIALRFVRQQLLSARMWGKPLHRTDGTGGVDWEWRYDE